VRLESLLAGVVEAVIVVGRWRRGGWRAVGS
jgi:hypothetical protein